jgi:hypothetical protein
MLDFLIDCMENNQEMTLTLFGHHRQGNSGRFISLNPAIPLNNSQDQRAPRQNNGGYGGGRQGYGNGGQQGGRSYQRPQQNTYQSGQQNYQRGGYAEQSGRGAPQRGQERISFAPRKQPIDAPSMDEFRKGDGFPENLGGNDDPLPWEE